VLYFSPPARVDFSFLGILLTVCVFAFLVGVVTYLPILPQSVTHFSPEFGGCL
jgi:hypothetical protein